ncbi:MAG: aminotransferase class I/II-fold pyridoxal phosphate-dependent enzyme, partial [Kordiimonadaceae bacterium]|nr:aminotransferase class I/II-fold pyridoxal phosphate-dependent enzyme [Kordiimonadaceae bacterium]
GVNSIKWDSPINLYGREKIKVPMGIADSDFRQHPAVAKAMLKRAAYDNYGYETMPDSFWKAIIDWNKQRYNLDLKKEWIETSPALDPGLIAALRGLNPHKGKVIMQTPVYDGFLHIIAKAGMTNVTNPMKKIKGRWHIDLENLEKLLDYETKCLILCNPNNPTGECWTANELRALGDVCMRNGVTVLADEIHCDFINKGNKFTPYASIGEKYANSSITFRSPSKTFGQASMKVAYFYTQNTDLMNAVMVGGGLYTNCNTFGLIGCEVAYNEGAEWVDDVRDYVDGNFDYLVDYVNKQGNMPGIKYSKPEGTYFAWLDCNGLKDKIASPEKIAQLDPKKLKEIYDKWRDIWSYTDTDNDVKPEMVMGEWLVQNSGVVLNCGHFYGTGSDGFMRMNIAVPRSQLKTALDDMNKALNLL